MFSEIAEIALVAARLGQFLQFLITHTKSSAAQVTSLHDILAQAKFGLPGQKCLQYVQFEHLRYLPYWAQNLATFCCVPQG